MALAFPPSDNPEDPRGHERIQRLSQQQSEAFAKSKVAPDTDTTLKLKILTWFVRHAPIFNRVSVIRSTCATIFIVQAYDDMGTKRRCFFDMSKYEIKWMPDFYPENLWNEHQLGDV